MTTNTIFVQIASYRDPQLIPTINDLINHSDHPENLHIVVCWQHGEDESIGLFIDDGFDILGSSTETNERGSFLVHSLLKNGSSIKLIDVHYFKTKGTCWARNLIQQCYNDEKYTLQLDSHHRFVDHIDTVLIDMLEGLREQSPKPLLTAYLPAFDPDNDPVGRTQEPWQLNFDRFIPEGCFFQRPAAINNWQSLNGKPIRTRFYSGHFCFADGIFSKECRHNPKSFFHGEEQFLAIKAFTEGYDLYLPSIVVGWHEYTRKTRAHIWDDHSTTEKIKGNIELDWVERNNEAHRLTRIMFGMDGENPSSYDFGEYSLGTKRTLREYEEYSGIIFKYRGVQQDTLDNKEPPNSHKYVNDEQWQSLCVRSNDVRILLHRSELAGEYEKGKVETPPTDFDFWYVGSADDDIKEIHRKDATEDEIKEYLKNQYIDFRLIWLGNEIPTKYVVWPHSKKFGWGPRIVKNIE